MAGTRWTEKGCGSSVQALLNAARLPSAIYTWQERCRSTSLRLTDQPLSLYDYGRISQAVKDVVAP